MSDRAKGVVAAIVLALVFASMGIFARYLSTDFTLLTQTYLRIGLAFLIGAVVFAHTTRWSLFRTLPWREWGILTLRAVSLYAAILLFSYALIIGNYSNVAFAASLPLLPLFGYFLFKEKLTLQILAFVALSFLGLSLIAVTDWGSLTFGYPEFLAFCSVILFDISYIARKCESGTLSTRESAMAIFFIGAILMFITSLALGEGMPSFSGLGIDIAVALFVAAILNLLNLTLTNYVFSSLSATLAGSLLTLETVFSLLISIFVYAEIPTAIQFLGSALILISVYRLNQLT
jgi:drug/metabolite transporter (DMT)-like permease